LSGAIVTVDPGLSQLYMNIARHNVFHLLLFHLDPVLFPNNSTAETFSIDKYVDSSVAQES
jgi:hypothetical protein